MRKSAFLDEGDNALANSEVEINFGTSIYVVQPHWSICRHQDQRGFHDCRISLVELRGLEKGVLYHDTDSLRTARRVFAGGAAHRTADKDRLSVRTINSETYHIETEEEPTTDEVLETLKKRRLTLKDETAAFLAKLERRI
jgi:Protein of unknown function (DUF465)